MSELIAVSPLPHLVGLSAALDRLVALGLAEKSELSGIEGETLNGLGRITIRAPRKGGIVRTVRSTAWIASELRNQIEFARRSTRPLGAPVRLTPNQRTARRAADLKNLCFGRDPQKLIA